MKKNVLFILITGMLIASCTMETKQMKTTENPFFSAFNTPYEVPAFDRIKTADFLPAFQEGIKRHQSEIDSIANNSEAPTFANTIEALDYSGLLLSKVGSVFFNLTSANTSDELQAVAKEVSPLLSTHSDNISLNQKLFQRVKTVYDNRDSLNWTAEQLRLTDKIYKEFVRGGANLNPEQQEQLRGINKELALLSLQFGDNLLAETNDFKLVIDKESDLAGLPQFVRNAAAEEAKVDSLPGKWVFTLQRPSWTPFLQYSEKRDLREKLYKAYINRGDNNNSSDNKAILTKIVSLRVKKANLLGYPSWAAFILEENMAKNPETVYKFLNQIWEAALPVAKKEAAELQAIIDSEKGNFKLASWDWWYYAEKLRKQKYDLDEEMLKPYFTLENVRNGMFDVATKLYGLRFIERTDIPKPHPDVKTFEVQEADSTHVGILLMDFFPRASKEGGAWMDSYRDEYRLKGKKITPVVTMVLNFTKPTGDMPSLLTFEEVSTLFHEFGHALHGLLSNTTYRTVSGTSVPRDFVEMPSQIMENWAAEPEVMKTFARHYKSGEVIPQTMIDKLSASKFFNQGFLTVEYMAASYLDMDWHTLTTAAEHDAIRFEDSSMNHIGLIPEIIARYRSPYFAHIFSGGYSAGYYSYIWAEVLDADAFEAFKETSLFDPATAKAFRTYILERGGADDPMKQYVKFRGREPKVDAMLKRRGLK
jgi:peptidyl-dipeptidase Dcp